MSVKIRPMTDLSKKMHEIEDLCINQSLPVYITKKGSERLVVLGHESYENLVDELENLRQQNGIYEKLIQAASESRNGLGRDFNDVMDEIDAELLETIEDERKVSR